MVLCSQHREGKNECLKDAFQGWPFPLGPVRPTGEHNKHQRKECDAQVCTLPFPCSALCSRVHGLCWTCSCPVATEVVAPSCLVAMHWSPGLPQGVLPSHFLQDPLSSRAR